MRLPKSIAANSPAAPIRTRARGPWVEDGNCDPKHAMCHDCAFRRDSKEMQRYRDGYGEGLCGDDSADLFYLVTRNIMKGLRQREKLTPFFCHHYTGTDVDVPQAEDGTYLYQLDARGLPIGVPVCNGWRAMVERIRWVMTEDGELPRKFVPEIEREPT